MSKVRYPSWGRNGNADHHAVGAGTIANNALPQGQHWLPYGNGRSYGDSCHVTGGCLIDSRGNHRIYDFDTTQGTVWCEAGVLLSELLRAAIPHGYFLPVTPGTQFVTVGGAIANDVHGKNHHTRGTFGCYVDAFELQRSDGTRLSCSPNENKELFAATIGGMGLTGLIVNARIRLMPVVSPDVSQRTIRFDRLDDFFSVVDEIDSRHEYSVAWIDQLAKGKHLGRGTLLAADHCNEETDYALGNGSWLNVPFSPPFSLLSRPTLKIFNEIMFRKENPGEVIKTVPWKSYFYPLDAITGWNKLYGPRGLYQHQSVYPETSAADTTRRLLETSQKHGHASFLTVLKRFGSSPSPGILSFPQPGYTLTLDFSARGQSTLELLRRLDEIVIEAGGRVNPYKDARMGADVFEASFPDWELLEHWRDPMMMSDFWRRTALSLKSTKPRLQQTG